VSGQGLHVDNGVLDTELERAKQIVMLPCFWRHPPNERRSLLVASGELLLYTADSSFVLQ